MKNDKTISDLRNKYLTDLGGDLLPHISLYETAVQSDAVLRILCEFFRGFIPDLERKQDCKLAIVCFGSLARFEYVPGASDLDMLVISRSKQNRVPNRDSVRTAILEPLARANPWLILDDRDKILASNCDAIPGKELKYQILSDEELTKGEEGLLSQRRWQLLLESRCLYGFEIYEECLRRITPRQARPLLAEEGAIGKLNRLHLLSQISTFLVGFDDPSRIYKTPAKYWKSRLLREVFQFTNIANLVIGLADIDGASVHEQDDLRAPTLLKLIRLTTIAEWLDQRLSGRSAGSRQLEGEITQLLRELDIDTNRLTVGHVRYQHRLAQICHGIIMAVIGRFEQARTLLYDPDVQTTLERIPVNTNFESRFWIELSDKSDEQTISSLREARRSYLRYIAATTRLIREAVSLRTMRTFPRDWDQALRAFERLPSN